MTKKITFLFITFYLLFIVFGLSSCNISSLYCEHEYRFIETVQPNCEDEGYDLEKCQKCGKENKVNSVPALGHDYGSETVVSPTCSTSGYTSKICKVCQHEDKTNFVAALGHKYEITFVQNDGDKDYVVTECSVCHHIEANIEVMLTGSSLYATSDLSGFENSYNMKKFYLDLVKECSEFAKSTSDLNATQVLTVNGPVEVYAIGNLTPKNYNITITEALMVWKLLCVDNPGFYWLSNQVFHDGEGRVFYLMINKDYIKATVRSEIDSALKSFINDLSSRLNGITSDYLKAKEIHDYIINLADYAYEADNKTPSEESWAHNLVGIVLFNKGVCESYSDLYSYLCVYFDVNCIIVLGTGITPSSSNGHAWNYVEINDQWYGVDVTWDDSDSVLTQYNFFMKGASFISSHSPITNKTGTEYLYVLPSLCQRDYVPFIG